MRLLSNGKDFGLKHLNYTYQEGEGGIADALRLAEHFTDGDSMCVVLGDNVIQGSLRGAADRFRMQKKGAHLLLKAVHDPHRFGCPEIVDGKIARIHTKELREATETALKERKPLAIIVDEAHHLAEAARGSRLQSQLNHLKHFENAAGVSHILVGTYEMRPFRKANAQLACRSVDIHFPRYDATIETDAQVFQSVVWALQRQLPVEKEPLLLDHWEFLYARSIGCIGWLKMHLNRALNLALTEKAKTVTLAHLRRTAPSETRVELALRNALESEAELTESEGADERLLTLLGLRGSRESQSSKTQEEEHGSSPKKQGRRGTRSPGRDTTGAKPDEDTPIRHLANEEQAAG